MLGEFYGLTAASAAILDLPMARLNHLILQLNSGLDSEKISKFKIECEYLIKFLDEKVVEEYQSPELAKKGRAIELVKVGASDRLRRTYDIDLPETEEARLVLIEELKEEIEKQAKKERIPKVIHNRFEALDGTVIGLQEIDLSILKSLKRLGRNTLSRYTKISTSTSWEEVKVFNFRLSDIATRSPNFLLKIVTDFFENPNLSIDVLTSLCNQWISVIRENMEEKLETDPEDTERLLESLNSLYRFDSHIASVRGLDLSTSSLSAEDEKLISQFYEEDQLKKILEDLIKSNSITYVTLEAIVQTYFDTYRFDHDLEFLEHVLGIEDATFSEIDASFERLKSIGLFTLHRKNHLMFVEGIKKISFSKQKRTFIEKGGEGLTHEKLLRDIENLCRSLHTPGTTLEGLR